MFYVYVIESIKSGKRYVGFTSKMPEERLREHNRGTTIWTRKEKPFRMMYFEEYTSKNLAKKRERCFKSGRGREFIKKIIPA